jgi:hypothetical protein
MEGFEMNRIITIAIMTSIVLGACTQSPSEQDIQTAIAQTLNANPSDTVVPSSTLTLSPTPTNTQTLTPTNTNTPTNTPTNTRTPTPTKTDTPTPLPPATQTALAVIAQKTQVMLDAYATQTARAANITATAAEISRWATQIAPYVQIDIRELINYPDNHIGEKVVIKGRVFNIAGDRTFQMYYGWTYDAIYVKTSSKLSQLYEDNYITVYGTIGGEECFSNAYGAQICQPLLENAFWTK